MSAGAEILVLPVIGLAYMVGLGAVMVVKGGLSAARALASLGAEGCRAVVDLGGGVSHLAVAGSTVVATGGRMVTQTASGGVLAVMEGVSDALREMRPDEELKTAGRVAVRFLKFSLPMVAETETVMRAVLAEMAKKDGTMSVGTSARLQLTDGTVLPFEYALLGKYQRLLVGVTRNPNGTLEAVCAGPEGYQLLTRATALTIRQLAINTLRAEGFTQTDETKLEGDGFQLVLAKEQKRQREKVLVTFDPRTGQLRIDTRGMHPSNRPETGEHCPRTGKLLSLFKGVRPGPTWNPDAEPFDGPALIPEPDTGTRQEPDKVVLTRPGQEAGHHGNAGLHR